MPTTITIIGIEADVEDVEEDDGEDDVEQAEAGRS